MKKSAMLIFMVLIAAVVVVLVARHRAKLRSSAALPSHTPGTAYTAGTYGGSLMAADGRTRTYVLHVPAGYSADRTYPLVLVFHGGYGTGREIERDTGFDAKADAEGFIVAYPDGIDSNWNDGRGTADPDIDDVGFVRQLVTSLESQLSVDEARIYATGLSNGGMFTQRLGCELADVLAAIGPAAGPMPAPLLATCRPAQPIAVIGIQGGADPIVPLGGGTVKSIALLGIGKGGEVASATETMRLWAHANGCNAPATISHPAPIVDDGTSLDIHTYTGCKGSADVVYYIVQGMGHNWPPKRLLSLITGPSSRNLHATDVIWAFFKAHPKR